MIRIPDEHLPPVAEHAPGIPKLVGVPNNRGVYSITDPYERARFYYKEALTKLALAKYWSEKAEDVRD